MYISAPRIKWPAEFAAFIDKFFNEEMSKSHTAGAAIRTVKDGKLFFHQGLWQRGEKIPVVADKTLFRVASLSKLVTATAAMQLYERGRLELDAPVNKYLTFQLKKPLPGAARVAQLMTHTAVPLSGGSDATVPTAAQMDHWEII